MKPAKRPSRFSKRVKVQRDPFVTRTRVHAL